MRILITLSGENIFTEDEKNEINEKKFRATTTGRVNKKKFTLVKKKVKPFSLRRFLSSEKQELSPSISGSKMMVQNKSRVSNYFNNVMSNTFYPRHIRTSTEDEKEAIKKINLKKPIINIPKELQTKYISFSPVVKESQSEVEIEKSIPLISRFERPNYKFALNEIINNRVVRNLKKDIFEKEKMKNRQSVINESNFRSKYTPKSKLNYLNDILNYKKIKSDESELIKYLNNKTNISDIFLNKVVTSNVDEIKKYDKISQTVLKNQDMSKKLIFDIERKVKYKNNLKKQKGVNNLNRMKKNITLENEILEKYNNTLDRKLNYLEQHKEMEKNWKKYGVKYLTSKVYIKRKNNKDESSEFE